MNEEANRKLLKFAEFKFQTLADLKPKYRHEGNLAWVYPTGEINKQAPDFLDPELGLGWIFKYLVPKAVGLFEITFNVRDDMAEYIFDDETGYVYRFYDEVNEFHLREGLSGYLWILKTKGDKYLEEIKP